MMKIILSIVILGFLSNFASAAELDIDASVQNAESVPFLKFQGPGQWDSWLQMNLNFAPVADSFQQLQRTEEARLISRGEAHITVITPVEFWNILKPQAGENRAGITMDEIHQIAEGAQIQKSRFEIVCLGQGEKLIDGKAEKAFFIVVKSDDLVEMRKKIRDKFVANGGSAAAFDPLSFYPHITLGFTKRDLHESDGVIKDIRSCVSDLRVTH